MKENKSYKCVCGKCFDNGKSLQHHEIACKIYKQWKSEQNKIKEQEKESKRLPNGLFKCENPDCSNEHDGSFGSGRFCSLSCRRHYISLMAARTRLQAGTFKSNFKHERAPYGTWKCKKCGEIFETRA